MKNLLLALVLGTLALDAYAADAVKPYALDYCLYSKDKLGAMGKPVSEPYGGQEMKFCCKDCQKAFDKDPAAGIAKYDAAVAAKASGGAKAAQ